MAKMEFLDPKDGWQCICNMTGQDASQAAAAVIDALKFAHSCLPGGVHGDLRAANTLVRRRVPTDGASSEAGLPEGIWEVRFIDFEVGSLEGACSEEWPTEWPGSSKRYCYFGTSLMSLLSCPHPDGTPLTHFVVVRD